MANDPVTSLARQLQSGSTLFTAWSAIPDPTTADTLVRAGFDAAVLDMQHGGYDIATASAGISAVALAGKPTLVRIPVGDFATASRLLDSGASGIIAPMINTVADAEALVAFTKFPPVGVRSWGPARALALTGLDGMTYLREANSFHLTFAMIETGEALGLLDEILAVEGIDGVLVGPSDLSIGLSGGAVVDANAAAVTDALVHIAARCGAHGKVASAFCADGAKAREVAALGFKLCAVGTDQTLLRAAAIAELASARG